MKLPQAALRRSSSKGGSVLSPATVAVGAPAEAVKVEATSLSTGTVCSGRDVNCSD